MIFEYIRPIDPSPAQSEVEPVRSSDAPDPADLRSLVSRQGGEETTPLACPELLGQRVELPRFSGISLADLVLVNVPAPSLAQTPSLSASLPPGPRTLLGPGAMTMTLAIVATLVFGVAVVAQVH